MYYYIILVIAIILAIIQRFKGNPMGDIIIDELLLLVVSFVIGVLICTHDLHISYDEYSVKTELYGLNDFISNDSKISGSYVLIAGSITGSSSSAYNITYAYKDSNSIIRPKQIKLNDSNVGFIEDDQNYYEEKHSISYRHNGDIAIKWFGGIDGRSVVSDSDKVIDNIFHVPKGSVLNNVDVDLK